ncbi:MAG TPA: tetratricopeptide repeat protein [Bryobacteraceae bacterium]|jgi:tetratricopeptide (TPR) repeat protein|nr:tetratricopeptide repeat protein [Bryobacteraceae bacterium]
MKTRLTLLSLVACFALSPAFAQGPKPKSQKEVDALMAIQNAQNADARLAAIDNLLTKFADTEYKSMVLDMAVETARQKNDATLVGVWADRALLANPKDFIAMLAVADITAAGIKEFDLNLKDEVAKVEKNANGAIEALKDAPKLQPQMTDEQWAAAKKDYTSEAHQALAVASMNQKKYPEAINHFKTSIDTAATPDPAAFVRLGECYAQTRQYDDAIAAFDKAIAVPNVNPQVKQVAENLKSDTVKRKAAAAGGTGGTGAAAPKP